MNEAHAQSGFDSSKIRHCLAVFVRPIIAVVPLFVLAGCVTAGGGVEARPTEPPTAAGDPSQSAVQHKPTSAPSTGELPGDLDALRELASKLEGSKIEGWVFLFADTAFYSGPEDQTVLGRLAEWPPERRVGPDLRLIPARVIEEEEDWIRIETLTIEETRLHCGGYGLHAFDDYRLRPLVRRADLSPLIAEPSSQRFQDGTMVGVRGGVPLRMGRAGPLLRLDDGRFEVVLPEVLVHSDDETRDDDDLSAPLKAGLSYERPGLEGGSDNGVEPLGVYLADVAWFINGVPVHEAHSGWSGVDVVAVAPHPDGESGTLATAGTGCWTLTMISNEPEPTIARPDGVGRGTGRAPSPAGWKVAAGTEAFWKNGVSAGETLVEIVHHVAPETVETEAGVRLSCFHLAGTISVCHLPERVEEAHRD